MIVRLSQNEFEIASFILFKVEVIWIFLKKGVYNLTFEDFILSNCFFHCHKPPKRLILQDCVQCKHSDKYIFYTLRFDCSFAAANTIKPQLL